MEDDSREDRKRIIRRSWIGNCIPTRGIDLRRSAAGKDSGIGVSAYHRN